MKFKKRNNSAMGYKVYKANHIPKQKQYNFNKIYSILLKIIVNCIVYSLLILLIYVFYKAYII
jgi:hypothetical protein